MGQDRILPGGRGRSARGQRRAGEQPLFRVHVDHVLDALQTSWAVVRGGRVPPVSGPWMRRTRGLELYGLLEAVGGCQARQRMSIVEVRPLHLHVRRGFIVYGTLGNWLVVDWGSATVVGGDGARCAGLRPVQERAGMAAVRCHQTEAAIAGFSQVVGLTWVGGRFARRGRFISLSRV